MPVLPPGRGCGRPGMLPCASSTAHAATAAAWSTAPDDSSDLLAKRLAESARPPASARGLGLVKRSAWRRTAPRLSSNRLRSKEPRRSAPVALLFARLGACSGCGDLRNLPGPRPRPGPARVPRAASHTARPRLGPGASTSSGCAGDPSCARCDMRWRAGAEHGDKALAALFGVGRMHAPQVRAAHALARRGPAPAPLAIERRSGAAGLIGHRRDYLARDPARQAAAGRSGGALSEPRQCLTKPPLPGWLISSVTRARATLAGSCRAP